MFEEAWDILIEDDSDSTYHYERMILYPTLVNDLGKKSKTNWNTGVLGNLFALVRQNWARESLG